MWRKFLASVAISFLLCGQTSSETLPLLGVGGAGGPPPPPPPASVSLVQSAHGVQAAGVANSRTVSLAGVGSGNAVIVGTFTCNDPSCAVTASPTTSVAPTSGSCSAIAGTDTVNKLSSVKFFLCTGGGGSQTYTSTWVCPGGSCSYGFASAVEVTGQAASSPAEGGATNSGSGTALAATTGTLTQSSGEFVYAFLAPLDGTLTSTQTIIGGNGAYQITSGCVNCTVTNSGTSTVSSAWSESIVAIKHP